MTADELSSFFSLALALTLTLTLFLRRPYCSHICPYCDFNKYLPPADTSSRQGGRRLPSQKEAAMRMALLSELEYFLNWYFRMRRCDVSQVEFGSVYFGGGTPSLANPSTLDSVLEMLRKRSLLREDCEITLEANPTVSSPPFPSVRRVCPVDPISLSPRMPVGKSCCNCERLASTDSLLEFR